MRIIRLAEVMHLTGLARSTIYKMMDSKEFPASVSLGGRAVGWVEIEILDWIEEKVLQRDL